MKEDLTKASHSAGFCAEDLRHALVIAGRKNPAAGMLIEDMVRRAAELQRDIDRLASLT